MKRLTKLIAIVLACACSLSVVSGCKKDTIEIDETKTQLYISNYDAGIGRTWVEGIGASFEQAFKNYSFEEGKTGVQVIYNHNRVTNALQLEAKILGMTENIFFTEGIDYPSLVSNKLLYNVTDIMTQGAVTGIDASGNLVREDKAIKDKVNPSFLRYLNRGTETVESYYAFPFYLALKSAIYDKALWDKNAYYLAKGAVPSEIVAMAVDPDMDGVVGEVDQTAVSAAKEEYQTEITKLMSKQSSAYWSRVNNAGILKEDIGKSTDALGKSAGPDGRYNTQDDGLPATYEEYYLLLDEMVKDGVTPLIFTGKFPGYAESFTTNLWWIHEGVENMKAYYSLTGTIDDVAVVENGKVKTVNGKVQTESVTFSSDDYGKSNGYEAQRMVGKYYALQFAEKIARSKDWLHPDCDTSALSHISAQSTFLTSALPDSPRKIAMIIDGAWWQQESSQTFETMQTASAEYSKMNRDIAMMNLPNATIDRYAEKAETGEKNVSVAMNDSFCVINNNLKEGSPQLAAAKMFMSYMNNDAMLNKFSEYTNMMRGMEYEINDETRAKMTKYGKHLIDYLENTDIVYPYSSNQLVIKNYGYLSNKTDGWNWHTAAMVGQKTEDLQYPISGMRAVYNANRNITAEDYFLGLYRYQKEVVWPKLI